MTLLFYAIARVFIPKGTKEVVSQTTVVTIQRRPREPHRLRIVSLGGFASTSRRPAQVPRPEIARITTRPAPPQVPHRAPSVPSRIERDEAGFAHEVAQLNEQNDPHAIPTIDPASRESYTKSYAFDVPSSMRGDEHGNGIITPVQSWHENGLDCYYGRYEFTYPDGAKESGDILVAVLLRSGLGSVQRTAAPDSIPAAVARIQAPARRADAADRKVGLSAVGDGDRRDFIAVGAASDRGR